MLQTPTPEFLSDWGRCDLCNQFFARRWLFKKTSHGVVVLCPECRERVTHNKKGEALDSWAKLPGSYGG